MAGNGGNLSGNRVGRPFIIEKRSKTGSDRPGLLPVDNKETISGFDTNYTN
jgi:hypothetical protein